MSEGITLTPPVTTADHEPADSYFINAFDEKGHRRGWARIFVKHGQRARHDGDHGPAFWCYVSVVSDFGNFGHLWSHCGCEPVRFLSGLSMDYAMGKLMHSASEDVTEYDGEATARHILRAVIDARRKRYISRDEAQDLACAIEEERYAIEHGRDEMVNACLRIARDHDTALERASLDADFGEPWTFAQDRINPQARDFWKFIWPPFIQAMKARELEREVCHGA